MKRYYILFVLVFAACSASQFTYYTSSNEEPPWRITVEKNPWESFACIINDSTVIEGSFPLVGFSYDSFEKDGEYGGRMIKMSGFRKTHETFDANGSKTTTNTYQIRIFIDNEEIAVFNF